MLKTIRIGVYLLFASGIAQAQNGFPDREHISYPHYVVPNGILGNPSVVTGVWDFVKSDGTFATGTWLNDTSVDWQLCTREWAKYASETGSNGVLVVYSDMNRFQKWHVAAYLHGRQNGVVAWFWPDGSPRWLGQMVNDSWRVFLCSDRRGRLREVMYRVPPDFVLMGWHSNGVPRYFESDGPIIRWAADGTREDGEQESNRRESHGHLLESDADRQEDPSLPSLPGPDREK